MKPQTWYPRMAAVNTTAATMSSSAAVEIPLHNERLLVTLTSGSTGDDRYGTYMVWVSGH